MELEDTQSSRWCLWNPASTTTYQVQRDQHGLEDEPHHAGGVAEEVHRVTLFRQALLCLAP